eukprot:CAMPEP_0182466292 /NCGR_PEP_ID=MMETSP1319-20130603/11685_1 /TAXON_ID=172717 /ORGANISM="Bolidomonas pacifica, Strain RCC208" /LENGTH=72 /DNA_ID=CAMNT_0024666255 /DNA_START=140 /DNA_END=355 /DNA_ORIENTATION=+
MSPAPLPTGGLTSPANSPSLANPSSMPLLSTPLIFDGLRFVTQTVILPSRLFASMCEERPATTTLSSSSPTS